MIAVIRTAFDSKYDIICEDISLMGNLIDSGISQAMFALVDRDITMAKTVIKNDKQVNELRFKVEEASLALIATQQPAAGDLRAVIAATHIVVELERIGDYAAGIARTVIMMSDEPPLKTQKKLPKMGELSQQMVADSIQAFIKRDATWAREIAKKDKIMDRMYKTVFSKLVAVMAHKPELVTQATYLLWCAHNLERIADRVTNISERTIFMATGDLREL
jgi:phosphate transport system protein